MTQFLPSPSVAPTSARECADFSFSHLPRATVPEVDGATAALPGKHSQAVVTNFESAVGAFILAQVPPPELSPGASAAVRDPWKFNAALAGWGR